MKFAFIAKHRHVWPVSWLCEALDVSRSGFHAWLRRGPSAREAADKGLTAEIRLSFVGSARTYGAHRVWRDVLAESFSCGLHKVERLMRMNALRARPRRRGLPKRRRRQIAVRRSQPSRSAIHRRATEPEVDRGLHIYLDGRGLALCCGGDRPLLAKSRRLVDESRDDCPTRHRCPRDGDLAAWKTRRSAASFRQSEDKRQFPGGPALIAMDQPVRLAPRGALCGVTHTQIDRPCLSPDLSTARERLAVRLCLADACDPRRA
jgi:HTH-like domain